MINPKHLLFCLILSLTLSACQQTASAPTSTPSPSRLNLVLHDEPATLDPHRTSQPASSEIMLRICETLVYGAIDGTYYGWLAESWEFSEAGRQVTFTLREGVTFHDGSPFTAEAVKFTFERIKHADSFNSPLHENFQGVTIDTPDERTVTFTFKEPYFDLLDILDTSYAVILPPTADEQFGQQPICTGIFQFDSWEPTQYIRLKRNPDYRWPPLQDIANPGPAKIDELQYNIIPDSLTAYQALLNGEVDILPLTAPEAISETQQTGQFNHLTSWLGGITYFGFNYQRPPFDEPLVRQAIAQAIDKQTIVQAILPGLAEPAFAPLAPNVFGFSSELAQFAYPFDPDRSRELLQEAGFEDTDGDGIVERNGDPFTLEVLTPPSSPYPQIYVFLQSQLQAIGIASTVRTVPPAEIAEITPTGDFDTLLYYYNWPYPSALSLFLSTERIGSSNRVGYSNPEVDTLLTQAEQQFARSPEQAASLLAAQKQILQDAPWQPIFASKQVYAINKRVQGPQLTPQGYILLHDVEIVR